MSVLQPRRAVIALVAGGTGGHVFPALAVGQVLSSRGYTIAFITDQRGAAYLRGQEWLSLHILEATALKGGDAASLRALPGAVLAARRVLKHLRPKVVIGFGGYASLATVVAARIAGILTCIHEQNAVMGRVNRAMARLVDTVALSFPDTAGVSRRASRRAYITGNPVREEIAALADNAYVPPKPDGLVRLLVLGGSQGAAVFSEILPAALLAMPPGQRERMQITQQCRAETLDEVARGYREANVAADLAPFFDDVAERLTWAHLVIARAGASTVSELEVAGKPAILVPLPSATDDHQTANAASLERAGGAWLVPQHEFTPAELAKRLQKLIIRPETLEKAAAAARLAARPDAAAKLADLVAHLAAHRRPFFARLFGGLKSGNANRQARLAMGRAR